MKIIHSADIHLGSKIEAKLPKEKADIRKAEVRQAFNKMVNYAILNEIKVILISGDLFDSKRPLKKDKEFFYSVVKNNPDIDFIYLKGNHDISENDSNETISNLKTFSDNWKTFFYDEVTISGIELLHYNKNEIINGLALPENKKNIVMMHGEANKIPKIKEKNIDYIALGHIHSFSEVEFEIRGRCFYSGCLEGRGFDETGIKGFAVIDTDIMSVDFIPNSVRIIEEYTVDISCASNSYEVYKIVKDSMISSPGNIYLINLYGEINFDGLYLAEDIEAYLKDDCFFAYVKNFATEKFDFKQIAEEKSLKGEFVRVVLSNASYSQQQKEQIISVGLKAFNGQAVLR